MKKLTIQSHLPEPYLFNSQGNLLIAVCDDENQILT